jgi:hypothetical protein
MVHLVVLEPTVAVVAVVVVVRPQQVLLVAQVGHCLAVE